MKDLKEVRCFLLDMDGTFYLGEELLPGAKEFLAACEARGIEYSFLTNNSSKSGRSYLEKLERLGVHVGTERMFTSGDATLLYLKEQGVGKEILLIGTPSLEEQFRNEGYELRAKEPEVAVLGFDTTVTYEKLTIISDAVRAGVPFIATHPDLNCPVPGGFVPDIGPMIAFVQASAGRGPDVVVGKPNNIIAEMAARRFGLQVADLCMVGDRLYTDIALGKAGLGTALVLCGETQAGDVPGAEVQPDFVFRDLAAMTKELERQWPL